MGSDEVRRTAMRVRQIGDDVRRLADQTPIVQAEQWRSTTAEGFRRRLTEQMGQVRIVAATLDDASEMLLQHAVAIENVFNNALHGGER